MLHALFPELPPRAAGATLRRIWSTHLRTLLLRDWMRRNGMEPIRPLVRECEALGHLRAPMLLSTFHIGPTLALGVLSERLQGETLVLRGAKFPLHRTTRLNIDFVEGSEQQRAATFHRAIEYLRGGGFVVVALDPRRGRPARRAVSRRNAAAGARPVRHGPRSRRTDRADRQSLGWERDRAGRRRSDRCRRRRIGSRRRPRRDGWSATCANRPAS